MGPHIFEYSLLVGRGWRAGIRDRHPISNRDPALRS